MLTGTTGGFGCMAGRNNYKRERVFLKKMDQERCYAQNASGVDANVQVLPAA